MGITSINWVRRLFSEIVEEPPVYNNYYQWIAFIIVTLTILPIVVVAIKMSINKHNIELERLREEIRRLMHASNTTTVDKYSWAL